MDTSSKKRAVKIIVRILIAVIVFFLLFYTALFLSGLSRSRRAENIIINSSTPWVCEGDGYIVRLYSVNSLPDVSEYHSLFESDSYLMLILQSEGQTYTYIGGCMPGNFLSQSIDLYPADGIGDVITEETPGLSGRITVGLIGSRMYFKVNKCTDTHFAEISDTAFVFTNTGE
ncbi:MAG: hypothetical protein PUC29_01610 [Clostridia bacterium]|nr:hypothetical protein [Clostridia bacterium]